MTTDRTPTPLRLAVALDASDPPVEEAAAPALFAPGHWTRLARLAERGTLDFVTLADSFAGPGIDAAATLARVAPETRHIGLVPALTTTHTEPFHLSSTLATLDWVSRGRAGWTPSVSATEAEAALFGRRQGAPPAALWREAGEVADVVARLWDSWEDDAEIRDASTGRFIDRDKLHYVDFAGEYFSVRGPAIVPRPPQGRPVTVADLTDEEPRGALAPHTDVALVRAADPVTARDLREELRARVPGLTVLVSLPVELHGDGEAAGLAGLLADWAAEGAADGFHLCPAEPARDIVRIVDTTVPLLRERGLARDRYEGATLRAHLGLPRPDSRYAPARESA
ncbi:LLM class flavin-dependent oxidoreductase [Streptomyces daliensis]|uniref:LLM class flavin-dependent oxidoreductase n=1 Tax=Streptomyces daliensis TaxID=299421 RepID=A0A8T4J097_9ACTN|nr:LLM class flavin-dependent oxidoreductase [Streptomyces daliensis]